MKRLLFIFLDGVGIGEASNNNPFYVAQADFLPFYNGQNALPDGTPVKAIDPVLGVEGLPQSATGQTTLFTGENIPAMLKKHKGSYPNKLMRKIIKEKNIISRLRAKKLNAGFINAYPFFSEFFTNDYINIREDGSFRFSDEFPLPFKRRISVTTCIMITSHLVPFNERDIIEENAIYQDYSNLSLKRRIEEAKKMEKFEKLAKKINVKLPQFSPEKAAEILFKTAQKYDFILYEYFQTDLYAHRRTFADRIQLIRKLNRLIGTLVSLLNREHDTLLVTSDHGNLEESAVHTHTRNPVPLVVWGNQSHRLRNSIESLVDVTPAVERFFVER
jgi:hypothetical protein